MRKTPSLCFAALALMAPACNKTKESAVKPTDPAAVAPKAVEPAPAPAGEAAKPSGEGVRAPTADDLATYTADLKGSGPLSAHIETSMGTINCELFDKKAPMTVANFVGLARGKKAFLDAKTNAPATRPFYDGLIFHRVIPEFMIQGGDQTGSGRGDPGYRFATEVHPDLRHDRPGTLSMANAGPNTNGSQFYITETATPFLDQMQTKYNVFGLCKEVDIVKAIARVPRGVADRPNSEVVIKKITITRD